MNGRVKKYDKGSRDCSRSYHGVVVWTVETKAFTMTVMLKTKGVVNMDFGLTGKLGEYYLAQQYQKNRAAGKSSGVSFAEIAAGKAKQQGWGVTENSSLVNYYSACRADLEGNPVWSLLVQCPWSPG